MLFGSTFLRFVQVRLFNRAKLERPLVRHESSQFDRNSIEYVGREMGQVLETIRSRHVGHLHLVCKPFLGTLKRCSQVEYRSAVLDSDNAAVRETAAVARPVDLVDDRRTHITAPQEVSVQGVRHPALYRVLRRR
jgi:hypothetical protein